jgi:hypothetical protein
MTCIHCGKQIQYANAPFPSPSYRHTADRMITCFGEDGKPLQRDNGGPYFFAEPKDSK